MKTEILFTGLKAVDLLAPIPLGGDNLVSGDPRSGARILGMELVYRLSHHPVLGLPVVTFLDSGVEDAKQFEQEFQSSAPGSGALFTVDTVRLEDIVQHRASGKSKLGSAVFAISKNRNFIESFRAAVKSERRSADHTSPLTSFVITETLGAEESVPDGYNSKLISSRLLAAEGVYPAIDPRLSVSTAKSSGYLDTNHSRTAEVVRAAAAEVLAELSPGAFNDENWKYNKVQSKRPALQALKFISQPYFCSEQYTGLQSAYVPIEEIVENFRSIVAGRYSGNSLHSFSMKNSLPEELLAPAGTQL